jgi:hypothetical protein
MPSPRLFFFFLPIPNYYSNFILSFSFSAEKRNVRGLEKWEWQNLLVCGGRTRTFHLNMWRQRHRQCRWVSSPYFSWDFVLARTTKCFQKCPF